MNPNTKKAIHESLQDALPRLSSAKSAADQASLHQTHHDLYTAISNAYNACLEAIARVHDRPDEQE
jgi:hypothetical protein